MDPFGVYVHVPFCAARCDYCAFATWTDRDHLMEDYVAAVVGELEQARRQMQLRPATSVFVGGGTPSRLPGALLAEVLQGVERANGAEVTVECNPEGADPERFAAWQSAGVTRVSIGAQSMVPHVLDSLGRRQEPGTVADAAALAGACGFDYNVDLIFGAAAESDGDLRATLDAVLGFDPRPSHVSAYALTVEPGTPLGRDRGRHPDDDVLARRYEIVDGLLSDAGYRWYEISNWALPGHECRHNQLYWRQGDYRGVGCAAHSHRQGRRWWNIRTPERYVAAVRAGVDPMAGEEVLDESQRAFEALALSLRTRDGVPGHALPDDPDIDGLVTRDGGRAVLTVRGRLVADDLTRRLQVPSILPA